MIGIALIIAIIAVFAFSNTETRSMLAKLGGAFLLIIAALFGTFILWAKNHEHKIEDAKQKWEWQHYTGYRNVCGSWDGCNMQHGVWMDKKTGELCTDSKYPGYRDCSPQEYVINGVVAQPPPDPFATGAVPAPPPGFGPPVPIAPDFRHKGFERCITGPNGVGDVTDKKFRACQRLWYPHSTPPKTPRLNEP